MTFWKEEFDEETLAHIYKVRDKGLNLFPLMGRYKKLSKLSPPIPNDVIKGVCREYLKVSQLREIEKQFPYFLRILEQKTRDYFANEAVKEHEKMKKEPVKLKIKLEM